MFLYFIFSFFIFFGFISRCLCVGLKNEWNAVNQNPITICVVGIGVRNAGAKYTPGPFITLGGGLNAINVKILTEVVCSCPPPLRVDRPCKRPDRICRNLHCNEFFGTSLDNCLGVLTWMRGKSACLYYCWPLIFNFSFLVLQKMKKNFFV